MNTNIKQYQNIQLQSMSPIERVIWCYNKIIYNLKEAQKAIIANDFQAKYTQLEKAKEFVNILILALDFTKSQEVAQNLLKFYENMLLEITYVNISKNPDIKINNIITQFNNMKDTWNSINIKLNNK
jgi:flagellar biosynthetic protein FliS